MNLDFKGQAEKAEPKYTNQHRSPFLCFILRLHSILGTSMTLSWPHLPFSTGGKKKVIHNPPNKSALFVLCDKAKGAFTI